MTASSKTTTRRLSGHPVIDAHKGIVIGSDEAGYGCIAGPLVVCAVAAPVGWDDARVKDSKDQREDLRGLLHDEFVQDERFLHQVVTVSPEDIDRIGVYQALMMAHRMAIQKVYEMLEAKRLEKLADSNEDKPVESDEDNVLAVVDGNMAVHRMGLLCRWLNSLRPMPVIALPKGDRLIPECSLASTIAKTVQCRAMVEYEREFPGYDFGSSHGYGTEKHLTALREKGPCSIHRQSYDPVKEAMRDLEAAGTIDSVDLIESLG